MNGAGFRLPVPETYACVKGRECASISESGRFCSQGYYRYICGRTAIKVVPQIVDLSLILRTDLRLSIKSAAVFSVRHCSAIARAMASFWRGVARLRAPRAAPWTCYTFYESFCCNFLTANSAKLNFFDKLSSPAFRGA